MQAREISLQRLLYGVNVVVYQTIIIPSMGGASQAPIFGKFQGVLKVTQDQKLRHEFYEFHPGLMPVQAKNSC